MKNKSKKTGKQILWTPWRMQYVMNTENGGCIFCKKQKMPDIESFIITRKKTCFSMLNIYPYNNGHLMVAPKRHISRLDLLTKKELCEIIQLITENQKLLQKKLNPQGFNIGLNTGRTAGAGIADHLHFHIVPRWDGDTNFMPVIGQTKVMPQLLEETYLLLKNA